MGVTAQLRVGEFSLLVGMLVLCCHDGQLLQPNPTGKNLSVGTTKIIPKPHKTVCSKLD